MERNLLLKIQYDGSAYHGWQVQENARSVQGVFQEALKAGFAYAAGHQSVQPYGYRRARAGILPEHEAFAQYPAGASFGRTQSFSAAGHCCAFLRRSAA